MLSSIRDPNAWPDWVKSLVRIVTHMYGALALSAVVFLVLRIAADVHLIAGVVATFVAAILMLALVFGLKDWRKLDFSWSVVSGIFLLATLTAICVFSSASWLLYSVYPDSFSPNPESSYKVVDAGTLADFYVYLFIDALPGLKLWDTFHVHPPMNYNGLLPAAFIFMFRTFVVVRIVSALKDWIGVTLNARQQSGAV
jgi:hypothetical protein